MKFIMLNNRKEQKIFNHNPFKLKRMYLIEYVRLILIVWNIWKILNEMKKEALIKICLKELFNNTNNIIKCDLKENQNIIDKVN